MLELRKVCASYGDLQVLTDVSFRVRPRQVVAVLGANGAGKSTLMRTIAGSLRASGGEILLRGDPIHALPAHEVARRGVALVPEGRKLFAKLSVYDNLLMGSHAPRAKARRAERLELVFNLFPVLKERARQSAGTLSGGEQQMCAIARGLMADPDMLLLDEIFLGIAPVVVERLYATLTRLKAQGLTMLLVEQNTRWALAIADYAVVLQTGRVVAEGTPEALERMDLRKAYLGI